MRDDIPWRPTMPRGDRRADKTRTRPLEDLGHEHEREARPQREDQRRGGNQPKAARRQGPLPAHRIRERAAGDLRRHRRQPADLASVLIARLTRIAFVRSRFSRSAGILGFPFCRIFRPHKKELSSGAELFLDSGYSLSAGLDVRAKFSRARNSSRRALMFAELAAFALQRTSRDS